MRIQARKVRSLASVKRGSGSAPPGSSRSATFPRERGGAAPFVISLDTVSPLPFGIYSCCLRSPTFLELLAATWSRFQEES